MFLQDNGIRHTGGAGLALISGLGVRFPRGAKTLEIPVDNSSTSTHHGLPTVPVAERGRTRAIPIRTRVADGTPLPYPLTTPGGRTVEQNGVLAHIP